MTSHTGPILVIPRIQPLGSVDFSSRGKVYSRHVTGSTNCKISSVCFVMKYCPTSTVFRNPASVQILINRSRCGSFSTRSLCYCNKFSCARISIVVLVSLSIIWLARTVGQFALPQQVSLFLFVKYCIPHTHQQKELCGKQFQSYHHRHRRV